MKKLFVIVAMVWSGCVVAGAQDTDLQQLKQQMQQMQLQMKQMQDKINALEAERVAANVAPVTPAAQPVAPTAKWNPAQPVPLFRSGGAYMNVSFVGDSAFGWSTESDVESLQRGHHDPSQRGFTLTNAELELDGAVDPYFKGFAAIVMAVEPGGETVLELEEAYFLTTSLPWNLQLKGGTFFTEFGRQNSQHPHAWAFVDQPLVLNRMFGADGLRNPGARLSWLAPTPFYLETMLGVFNSDGETTFSFRNEESVDIHGGEPVERALRGPQDLLFVPRIATSFDLTDTQTIVLGASGAFGPNNSGSSADTQVYGADLYWKWKPTNADKGFPFVSWQTEALYRRYEAAVRTTPDDPPGSAVPLSRESLSDWGFYSQLLWGIKPRWVAGLRGEFVSADEAEFDSEIRLDRTRFSPNLTWYPSEFSRVRLQYNFDHRQDFGDDHSVWLQFEYLLGAHAAHKF